MTGTPPPAATSGTDAPGPADEAPPALRIAIAIESFTPRGGGAQRSTDQIARGLADRGHDVTVLAPAVGDAAYERTYPYRVERWSAGCSVGAVRLLLGRRWVAKRIDSGEFDVALSVTTSLPGHVVEPRAGVASGFQRSRVLRRRSPVKRAVKRLEVGLSPKQWLLRRLERRTLADARLRGVVAISGLMEQELREAGVADDRVTVIPNGGETPRFTRKRRAALRRSLRRGLSLDDDAPLLVFAANDPGRKGGDELLRAFVEVNRQRPDARLAIVGDGGYACHRAAVSLGVRGAVLLLGVTQRAPELFAAADALVLPTWYDPASKVVIESLMVGTPVVTTRLNGSAQFVEPPDRPGEPRGRVIDDPRDEQGLTDAMIALCDAEEQRRCAARCDGLHEALSMDRHVERLESVLRAAAEA